MNTNTIIILTAVFSFIAFSVVYFIILVKKGRKNASKISPRVVNIVEGRFISPDNIDDAAFDLLDDVNELELNDKENIYTATKIVMSVEYTKTRRE